MGKYYGYRYGFIRFPYNGLKRIDDSKYIELYNSITAQTTGIQQELPFGADTLDKEYVKKVLLKHAKKSWLDLRSLTLQFLIELRDRPIKIIKFSR